MSDYTSPLLLLRDLLITDKALHLAGGFFLWELLANLPFDYSMLSGDRPRTRSFWLYIGCRWFPIVSIGFILGAIDRRPPQNCTTAFILSFVCGGIGILSSTGIALLRLMAAWRMHRTMRILGGLVWFANVPNVIILLTKVRAIDDLPQVDQCVIYDTAFLLPHAVAFLCVEMFLTAAILAGLVRLGSSRHSSTWRLMYRQDMLWLMAAILVQAPLITLLALNLNDALNILLLLPSTVIIPSISSTRMYRSLILSTEDRETMAVFVASEGHSQPFISVYTLGKFRIKFVRWGMPLQTAQADSCQLQDIRVHVQTTIEQHIDDEADESL